MLLFPDEPNGGGSATPPAPAPAPDGLPPNDPNGESTTPEEVAATLKSSGIKLPEEPAAAAEEAEEGDDPDEPAAASEEEAEEEPAPAEEEEEVEQPAEENKPEVVVTADEEKYSFEIEDANGVTYKILPGAKMEDILKDFEPKNNGQILDILDKLRDMKAQKASDEATEAENTAKQEQAQRVSAIREGWKQEETDLTAQKRIPEGKEGEDRVKQVYQFMATENDARIKANKPTIGSFEDALDKLEAKEARDKAVADAKAEKETARANGGKVGGSSAPATGSTPVYRAGSARNANEAIRNMNLIK